MKKRILLLWYMEDENFGDVLISKTVKEILRQDGYEVEEHEVGDDANNIIHHANACNFLLFAGGGIIERYAPKVIRDFHKCKSMLNVPFGVIGVGVGEFNYENYIDGINAWVRGAEFFFVRDKHSANVLNGIVGMSKVQASGDCVFANKDIRHLSSLEGELRGINIRDLPYKDLTGDLNWNVINAIIQQEKINHVIMDCSDDIRFILDEEGEEKVRIYRGLSKNEKVEHIVHDISVCEFIIAMRFHVVLVAAMMGIPSIPIMYCPKVKFLCEQLGIMDLAVMINNYADISDRIKYLEENYDKIIKTIRCNVRKVEKDVDAMFEKVLISLKEI